MALQSMQNDSQINYQRLLSLSTSHSHTHLKDFVVQLMYSKCVRLRTMEETFFSVQECTLKYYPSKENVQDLRYRLIVIYFCPMQVNLQRRQHLVPKFLFIHFLAFNPPLLNFFYYYYFLLERDLQE